MTTESLYARFADDLRAYFARRSPADAVEDLVQETFARIHHGLPALRDRDRVAPWVFRVARSALIDHLRRARPAEPLTDPIADPGPTTEVDATAVVASWLPAMIDALDAPTRDALRLSEIEGLSQREVAERLGLSPSGARTRVQRGRARLREALLACCHVAFDEGEVVDVRPNLDGCGCG